MNLSCAYTRRERAFWVATGPLSMLPGQSPVVRVAQLAARDVKGGGELRAVVTGGFWELCSGAPPSIGFGLWGSGSAMPVAFCHNAGRPGWLAMRRRLS